MSGTGQRIQKISALKERGRASLGLILMSRVQAHNIAIFIYICISMYAFYVNEIDYYCLYIHLVTRTAEYLDANGYL